MTTVSQEAVEVTQALKYSRMADPEAWENADVGRHSRENNIRLARANAMGKARYLSELLAGFSQSQFVEAAASENGENLLNALVGVLSDYPNHRQQAERGEAWRPIETAPYDTPVEVKVASMTFLARLLADASMSSLDETCDQWQAEIDGEHPPCWSGGACWASNENEDMSLQPTAWRYPPAPEAGQ